MQVRLASYCGQEACLCVFVRDSLYWLAADTLATMWQQTVKLSLSFSWGRIKRPRSLSSQLFNVAWQLASLCGCSGVESGVAKWSLCFCISIHCSVFFVVARASRGGWGWGQEAKERGMWLLALHDTDPDLIFILYFITQSIICPYFIDNFNSCSLAFFFSYKCFLTIHHPFSSPTPLA